MANPIKGTDLIHESVEQTLKRLESQLISILERMEDLNKTSFKVEATLKKQNVATSQGRQEIEKAAKEADKLKKAQEKLNESYSETAIEIIKVREETRQQNRINKLNIKLAESAKGSYDQLAAQHAINQIKLRAMSKEMRQSSDEGQKLAETNRKIWEEMKRLQKETGPATLNVGNYKDSIKEAVSELQGMPGAAGRAGGAIGGLGQSFKALLANPIVGFIALIVGGLSALGAAFFKTERGAKFLQKATGALQGIMSAFVDIVDNLATNLVAVFNDPQQALKDFATAFKNRIINSFKGTIDLVVSLGKGLKALWQRDLEGLKNASKEAGTALIQMTTGLDAQQQANFANAVKETTNAVIDQANAFAELAARRRSIAGSNRALTEQLEKLITQEELLTATADDSTKSFAEREKAAEDARAAAEKRASVEIQIARNNLSLIREERRLRQANGENIEGLRDQELQAFQALSQAQRDYTLTVRDNEKTRSELTQDRLERDLDILIDGFDNQKTINERIVADESRTLSERQRLLEETQKLADDSFAKQIETIQQFTGVQVDANDLIAESDAVVLNQKIRSLGLSEIIEGRLLEIIRERRIATADLNEAETALNNERVKKVQEELKARVNALNKRREQELTNFDQLQALEKSKFDLTKATEAEKTKFTLEQEKERLKKILELNRAFGGDLSDVQIETIKNQIERLNNELGNIGSEQTGLFARLGFTINDEQKTALKSSFDFAKQQLFDYMAARTQAAERQVELSNTAVEQAQRTLQAELQADQQGFASRVETARQELAVAKANQEKALKEREKAERAERRIQTIQQTVNLITATSKIWSQLGFPLAIPAVAFMWGSFIASKVKAGQVAKSQFGEGTYQVLRGGSHASGNDISLGFEHEGKPAYAEGGEGMAIFSKAKTRKYGRLLPEIVEAINRGTFEAKFARINRSGESQPIVVGGNISTARMEKTLSSIDKKLDRDSRQYDSKGRLIRYKNITYSYAS